MSTPGSQVEQEAQTAPGPDRTHSRVRSVGAPRKRLRDEVTNGTAVPGELSLYGRPVPWWKVRDCNDGLGVPGAVHFIELGLCCNPKGV